MELPVIDHLSRLNAVLSTWLANLLGSPAIRKGVLIETGSGLVGIDNACSGIRSFQATVMISLFLGELFRYGLLRRLFFLGSGLLLSFACNVARTTFLVRVCDLKGNGAVDSQHDPAGFAILGITLTGLLALAWLVRPKARDQGVGSPAETGFSRIPANTPASSAALTTPAVTPIPLGLVLGGLALWIVSIELGIETWFRAAERNQPEHNQWSLQEPQQEPAFAQPPIAEGIRNKLRYDQGSLAQWRRLNGSQWQVYYFQWLKPEGRYRALEATRQSRGHSTDLCLELAGMTLEKDFGTRLRNINGVPLLTRTERYLDHGRTLNLLSGYWEPDPKVLQNGNILATKTDNALLKSLRAIASRDRGRSEKRVLKLAVWGVGTDEAAESAFEELLRAMIRPEKAS
jgi:exosortase/archaeosortase family protein